MVDDANLENEQLEQFLRTVFLSRLEGDEFYETDDCIRFLFELYDNEWNLLNKLFSFIFVSL